METEQACEEVISWEAEARRGLCLVAAGSPAISNVELQADQVSCPEKHAGQMPLCPSMAEHTLDKAGVLNTMSDNCRDAS